MYPSVLAAYRAFSTTFEGMVSWMYTDVKNLVTTGMGNLIDPISSATSLTWQHGANGPVASADEVAQAWQAVKSSGLAGIGGGSSRFQELSDLRLSDASIDSLIASKLASNESILRTRFPGYDAWPADAQLGLLSMAWAMGPAFHFPKFMAAVNQVRPDFRTAATESHMNDVGNPGLTPRNAANYQLFTNAADALDAGKPLSELQWGIMNGISQVPATAVAEAKAQTTEVVTSVKRNVGRTVAIVGVVTSGIGAAMWKAGLLK